jgi:hypothetical protein
MEGMGREMLFRVRAVSQRVFCTTERLAKTKENAQNDSKQVKARE